MQSWRGLFALGVATGRGQMWEANLDNLFGRCFAKKLIWVAHGQGVWVPAVSFFQVLLNCHLLRSAKLERQSSPRELAAQSREQVPQGNREVLK